MSKKYHYIIVYNEDDAKFYIDYFSSVEGSDGHAMYDTNTNTWSSPADNRGDCFVDEHIQKVLKNTLSKLNNREEL